MRLLDKEILRLALPSIVMNVTVPLLGLCDVAIMGHVGGASHIGAIAVGSMIFNVMYWLFAFLRMGTSGITAQAFGARQPRQMVAALRQALLMALGFGLTIVVLQLPLRHLTFWLMQTQGEVAALCTPYYNICVWGAPAVLGLYALNGWLVGMQDTRRPMLIAIGQNVVNIGVSLTLVAGFGMGIKGVALGTLVAQWTGFVAGMLLVAHQVRELRRQQKKGGAGESGALRPLALLKLNLDIFLRTVCMVAVNLYFTSEGSAQGPLILAANTLLMQFFMLFSYVMDGFAFAGEALSGRFLGARQKRALASTVRRLFAWGVAVALVFTAAYWLGGTALLGLLTTDGSVVAAATAYLPWAVLIPAAGMAAFVWDGIFIGTTSSRGMLVALFWASVAFFVLRVGLAPWLHNHALWLALIVYLAMRGLVQTFVWRRRFARL